MLAASSLPRCAGIGGSAQSGPAKAFLCFVLGQAGDWLSAGLLALGVEGPRPDACGPAALQLPGAEGAAAGGGVGLEELAGLSHGGLCRVEVDGRGQSGDNRFAVDDQAVPVV